MDKTLSELCADWRAAKARKAQAEADMTATGLAIIAITGHKERGAETHNRDGHKIVVTGVQNLKMDWDAFDKIKDQIPANMHPVKPKREVDEKGVKWLRENKPELYALLPLTVTPGKTGLEVEELATETAEG